MYIRIFFGFVRCLVRERVEGGRERELGEGEYVSEYGSVDMNVDVDMNMRWKK